ncbi:hypothetical protein IAD21_05554 [Abditibacteriota bacterium]|nr:hypothetical protein IAD21_05554 [Abditibacteriota bacterium]
MSSFLPPHSFPPANERERSELLAWVRDVPLVYGAWTHWKSLWKEAEAAYIRERSEPELWTALLSRTDAAPISGLVPKSTGLAAGHFTSLVVHPREPLLYALREDGTALIFDVSTPVQPRQIGTFRVTTTAHRYSQNTLRIVGDVLLYLENEARAFDLSDARQPQFLSRLSYSYHYGNAVLAQEASGNPYLLVNTYNDQSAFTIPSKQNPQWTLINKIDKSNGYNSGMQAEGPVVVSLSSQWTRSGYSYSLSISDASDPRNLVERSTIKTQSARFQVRGNLLFQLNDKTFSITDLRDLSKPRQLGKLQLSRNDGGLFYMHGDLVVVVCGRSYSRAGSLILLDISQPQSPRVARELASLSWYPQCLAWIGDIAFAATNQGLRALDTLTPSRVTEVGQSPSQRTFAYMKRRGRRFERILAESDEAASFELTARLIEATRGQEALDFGEQWIVADALVGAGYAFEQQGHGRGPIVDSHKFHRRARLERARDVWDMRREIVGQWTGDEFPWQVAVVARRALGQTNVPFSTRHLNAILRGDWPFALLEAARQGQNRLGELTPDALAALLWCVNRRRRGEILRTLGAVERKGALAMGLANVLARHAPRRGGFGRRERDIALLLAARFDLSHRDFSAHGATRAILPLLLSNERPLRELGLAFCRRLTPEVALETAKIAPQIEAELLSRFYAALGESGRGGRFEVESLAPAIRHSDERVRRAVWAIIRGSKTANSVLNGLWTTLLRGVRLRYQYNNQSYRWELGAPVQTALDSDDALAVLGRAGAKAEELRHLRFQDWQPMAPAGLFGAWSLFADMSQVVTQIASAPTERWNAWKAAFARALPFSPPRVGEFWQGVRARLEEASFDHNLKEQLRARTFGEPSVAATFAGAVSSLDPALLIDVIAGVTDETWRTWRAGLLQTLQSDAAQRQAFWDAVRARGFDDILRARLVDDAEFAANFGLLTSVLEFDEPALEPLLLAWLQAHSENLSSEDAVSAALHSLVSVRDFGLRYLQERGLNTPTALRLVESRLPEPMRVAREWFEQTATAEPERAVVLALSLLDSPLGEARQIGRDFIASRLESLLQGGLLQALLENPNAEIQAFVAQLLLERESKSLEARDFDRAVLRGRDRARRAKTLVQTRHAQNEALPDAKTLLELARGKTPRDADWAWTQLARLAQSEAVDGIEVSGVGSI